MVEVPLRDAGGYVIKRIFLALALMPMFATAAHASKTILPDACGADKIKFDIDTNKDQPALPPAVEGKARIIFIETVINSGYIFGGPGFTTRFGVDGAWVGAAKNNTYFTLDVTPGKHHLCSSVQGFGNAPKDKIGITSFEAEAGKVYYVSYVIQNKQSGSVGFVSGGNGSPGAPSTGGGGMHNTGGHAHVATSEGLVFLDDDDGEYRVKASKQSQFKIQSE